jgi:superfamily II DNA or RNA helicase/enamine deaminase RidA (YjgF/YER057c/UK114 family)
MTEIEPYPYQKDALDALQQERENDRSHGLLIMPAGSGKTITSALDVKRTGAERILFVAPQREILEQGMEEFEKVLPEKSKGIFTGREQNYDEEIIFASSRSISKPKYAENFGEDEFDYIIYDEVHHLENQYYSGVRNYFNPEFTLGLTATPFLVDLKKQDLLEKFRLEKPSYEYKLDQAVENENLVPFEAHVLMDAVDYEERPEDLSEEMLDSKVFYEGRNKMIYEEWEKRSSGRKTVAFCRNIKHAEVVSQYFKNQGVDAELVHSRMSASKREKRIQDFREDELELIAGVDMFNEGVDFPKVSSLLFLRPTSSKRVFIQQLGRGLRVAEGKDRCLILDFVNKYDWQRMSMYGADEVVTDYEKGRCSECGVLSTILLEEDGKKLCRDCRTENFTFISGDSDIFIDAEAYFEIVEEYQDFRFNKKGIPEEMMLADLKRCNEMVDGRLKMQQYDELGRFAARTIQRKLGNFSKACEKAGIESAKETAVIPDEVYLEDVERVFKEQGSISEKTYREHGKYSLSPAKTHFGNWSQTKNALDDFSDSYEIPKKAVIREVRRLYRNHDDLDEEVVRENSRYDWEKMQRYGETVDDLIRETGIIDRHLWEDVARVMEKLGKEEVKSGEYQEHGKYGKETVRKRAGSWEEVREKARKVSKKRELNS